MTRRRANLDTSRLLAIDDGEGADETGSFLR